MSEKKTSDVLNAEKGLIWRIVHKDNMDWIFQNGLHCAKSKIRDTNFVEIGSPSLIGSRQTHPLPSYLPDPFRGSVLSQYVPFYFTPFSPMLYNILTGRGDAKQRSRNEIVIIVSSVKYLKENNLPFVFTDGHAYMQLTQFYTSVENLDKIHWKYIQDKDFKRSDSANPERFERYQAETLVYDSLPSQHLRRVVCYDESTKAQILESAKKHGLNDLKVFVHPKWYL